MAHSDPRRRLGRRQVLRSGLVAMLLLRTPLVHVAMASPAPERPRPGDPPDKPAPSGITVRPDDPGITTGMVEYPGLIGPVLGVIADRWGLQTAMDLTALLPAAGLAIALALPAAPIRAAPRPPGGTEPHAAGETWG